MTPLLREKPLIEAIFELRWRLRPNEHGLDVDPNYGFLPGLFQQAVQAEFPATVKLPSAQVPAEMLSHVTQYQFRKAPDSWPLVQLGPGVLTVNDTEGYSWTNNFETLCGRAITKLLAVYPNRADLVPLLVQLRFLNGIYLDEDPASVLVALQRQLKTTVALPMEKLADLVAPDGPFGFGLHVTYTCREPVGNIGIKLNRGKVRNRDALVWEIFVSSKDDQVGSFLEEHAQWLSMAHTAAERAFFAFLSEELLRRFQGDSH